MSASSSRRFGSRGRRRSGSCSSCRSWACSIAGRPLSAARPAIARIGRPAAVAGRLTHPVSRRRWIGLAYPLAWIALILGLSGPRRGQERRNRHRGGSGRRDRRRPEPQHAGGHDMADPPRPPAGRRPGPARRPARRHRPAAATGGDRRLRGSPESDVPAHDRLRPRPGRTHRSRWPVPAPEIRPGAAEVISGTRIAAALRAAVAAHDKRLPGYQDVVLISDGDDPADDREWARGSDEARRAQIPVHTVGVGNPRKTSSSPSARSWPRRGFARNRSSGSPPRRTGGTHRRATRHPALGEFFRSHLEPLPARAVSDEGAAPAERTLPWFLAPRSGCF